MNSRTGIPFRPAIAAIAIAVLASPLEARGNDLFHRVAEMVNDERQKLGLPRLTYDGRLEQAALSQAQWMAKVGKMVHLRGEMPKRFEEWLACEHHHANRVFKTCYLKWEDLYTLSVKGNGASIEAKQGANDRCSEVIAFASAGAGPVPRPLPIVVPGWMNSPGHRATIVKTCWRDIGAAFAVARDGSTYYCVVFGNPVR